MRDRTDLAIVISVMVAAAFVLAAPVLGRAGHPVLADMSMAVAALSGLGGFAAAALATWRASRRHEGDSR